MSRKQKLPFEHWQIIELLHIAQDFYSKPENEAVSYTHLTLPTIA